MDAQRLFPGDLAAVYEATRCVVLPLGDDIVEEFARTQVSFGSARKFAWLTPLTKTRALLVLDLWEERTAPQLRNVIRYREDKFTHQVEVRTAEDVEAVNALGWFVEAASWGRKRRS
jgi:predicted transport protein